MAPIGYVPKFQFTPDIDNVTRVQAGGPNGFNVRFQAIKAEFDALHLVVLDIDGAIAALSVKPQPQARTSTFTPNLLSTSTVAGLQWGHGEGFASVPPGQVQADGMMDVQLPQGSTINQLRVIGSKGSGDVSVDLRRQPIAHGSAPQVVATILVPKPQNGTFDVNAPPIDPGLANVDGQQFRYYIVARLDGGSPTATQGVELDAFMITHTE
jgi:hypothetical protein